MDNQALNQVLNQAVNQLLSLRCNLQVITSQQALSNYLVFALNLSKSLMTRSLNNMVIFPIHTLSLGKQVNHPPSQAASLPRNRVSNHLVSHLVSHQNSRLPNQQVLLMLQTLYILSSLSLLKTCF